METTSFDLNQAIQRWRADLGASPAFRSENLDELEGHLRDSVATLQTPAISVEEAFMIAAKRVGNGASLEKEFAKVNPQAIWLDRILWMLIGVQIWGVVSNVLGRLVRGLTTLGLASAHYDFATHGRGVPIVLFAVLQTATYIASLAFCWWLVVRKGQKFGKWIERNLQARSRIVWMSCLLWVVSIGALALGQGVEMIPLRAFDWGVLTQLHMALGISTSFLTLLQGITLIVLTLFLARKRMRLAQR